jgi:hypothetical protein
LCGWNKTEVKDEKPAGATASHKIKVEWKPTSATASVLDVALEKHNEHACMLAVTTETFQQRFAVWPAPIIVVAESNLNRTQNYRVEHLLSIDYVERNK